MWSAIRKLRENKWSYFKETFESEIKVSLFCLFLRFREFWSNGQNKKKKDSWWHRIAVLSRDDDTVPMIEVHFWSEITFFWVHRNPEEI